VIEFDPRDIIDLYIPPAPGSLTRSAALLTPGIFRLSRRDCELYCAQIVGQGAWAKACIMDGEGRDLWEQPSCFTGSFVVTSFAKGGLIAHLYCLKDSDAINFTVSWREPDKQII
jgi:hypothetical protein